MCTADTGLEPDSDLVRYEHEDLVYGGPGGGACGLRPSVDLHCKHSLVHQMNPSLGADLT